MEASKNRVHYYHASASPLGGQLTHPLESMLHSQASASLSQAGGHAQGRIENFRIDHVVSTGAAFSHIHGVKHKTTGHWTTLVTCVIENLNVLEVVTAKRIVCRIATEHPRDGYHPKVSFVGSQFEDLRIAGEAVNISFDHGLFAASRAGEHEGSAAGTAGREGDHAHASEHAPTPGLIEFPEKAWPDVDSFLTKAVSQARKITGNPNAPHWLKERFRWIESSEKRKEKGYILCSLVNEVRGTPPNSTFGHVVHVPGFGNIFLGELLVDKGSFHLAMLRIEMGCMGDGDLSFGGGYSNGVSMP